MKAISIKTAASYVSAATTLLISMGITNPTEADLAAVSDIIADNGGHVIMHPASIVDNGPFVA